MITGPVTTFTIRSFTALESAAKDTRTSKTWSKEDPMANPASWLDSRLFHARSAERVGSV